MKRNTPPSSSPSGPHVTTETFQKHYGRGAGYPSDPPHHGHPPPLPPPHHSNYPPSQHYGSSQHGPPPPLPPPGYRGGPPPGPPPPPPPHGYPPHPSWHYPPHNAGPPPEVPSPSSDSRRNAARSAAIRSSSAVPPSLVTPKSHDSETLPPAPALGKTKKVASKKAPAVKSSNAKRTNKAKSAKKESSGNKEPSSANNDKQEPEMEEEPKVEPMKQDFHFYAMDQYEEVKRTSQQQLEQSETSVSDKSKELYLLTTLLNARLVQNWESAPSSTRAAYLKKEEADRKRFMSEEEVASRHCATLTARRRSPKQAVVGPGGVRPVGSFGLSAAVEVPSMSEEGLLKRPNAEPSDSDIEESVTKRAKV